MVFKFSKVITYLFQGFKYIKVNSRQEVTLTHAQQNLFTVQEIVLLHKVLISQAAEKSHNLNNKLLYLLVPTIDCI